MTKIFVISMDNEIGKIRRDKLQYDYEWFVATEDSLDFIKDKMIHFWNSGEKHRKGKNGVSDSYYRLCKKIYEEKINNCIIAEDDCYKLDFPEVMPDKLCYLNGLIINKKGFKKYNEFSTYNGLNKIDYEVSRIIGTWGIYIPEFKDVLPIIKMFEDSKRLRCIDIMLSKSKIIKYYYYPGLFYIDDSGYSQIGNKITGIHKNYK